MMQITIQTRGIILLVWFTVMWTGLFFCKSTPTETDRNGSDEITGGETAVDTTTYYVSTNGDNDADGRSLNSPFRTIARALQAVRSGGAVQILPGVYSESLTLQNVGTDSDTIFIRGHSTGAILDGSNSQTFAFFCERCAGLAFENLEIRNFTDLGIGASQCRKMTFRNLRAHENGHQVQLVDWELEGYGIHVEESDSVTIENNDVYRNGPEPQIFPDFLMGTGINTYKIRNSVIRNNVSHDNIGGGILVEDSEYVIVESNEVYANDLDATVDEWWDGGLWLDGGHDVTVRDNVFRDNLGPGIEISDEDFQNPYGYILENNVSTRNYYGIYIWNFGTTDWPDSTIIQQMNNQFTNNSQQDVWIEQ